MRSHPGTSAGGTCPVAVTGILAAAARAQVAPSSGPSPISSNRSGTGAVAAASTSNSRPCHGLNVPLNARVRVLDSAVSRTGAGVKHATSTPLPMTGTARPHGSIVRSEVFRRRLR